MRAVLCRYLCRENSNHRLMERLMEDNRLAQTLTRVFQHALAPAIYNACMLLLASIMEDQTEACWVEFAEQEVREGQVPGARPQLLLQQPAYLMRE